MNAVDCKHHNCYALESCPCDCHASQRRPAATLDWPRILARAEAEAQRQGSRLWAWRAASAALDDA